MKKTWGNDKKKGQKPNIPPRQDGVIKPVRLEAKDKFCYYDQDKQHVVSLIRVNAITQSGDYSNGRDFNVRVHIRAVIKMVGVDEILKIHAEMKMLEGDDA